jgi:AcrR family transcriptional regulator
MKGTFMGQTDRRYRKTEKVITDSFIRLLNSSSIEELQINDLVKEADINRSTFYLHYTSLDDVLGALEDQTITLLSSLANFLGPMPDLFFKELVSLLYSNRDLFFALSNGHSYRYDEKLRGLFMPLLKVNKPASNKKMPDTKYLRLGSLISGLEAIVMLWLDDNCRLSQDKLVNELKAFTGVPYYKDLIKR